MLIPRELSAANSEQRERSGIKIQERKLESAINCLLEGRGFKLNSQETKPRKFDFSQFIVPVVSHKNILLQPCHRSLGLISNKILSFNKLNPNYLNILFSVSPTSHQAPGFRVQSLQVCKSLFFLNLILNTCSQKHF